MFDRLEHAWRISDFQMDRDGQMPHLKVVSLLSNVSLPLLNNWTAALVSGSSHGRDTVAARLSCGGTAAGLYVQSPVSLNRKTVTAKACFNLWTGPQFGCCAHMRFPFHSCLFLCTLPLAFPQAGPTCTAAGTCTSDKQSSCGLTEAGRSHSLAVKQLC